VDSFGFSSVFEDCFSRKVAKDSGIKSLPVFFYLPNVPSQEAPLASGMASARVAESAEAMPEVPKGR